ncbi:hypothetical protein [Cetobacterium sp.]|uniref:hypothetical protein n=1 Tax=Cetobacterium sp. TaxID=2071632 RepID=UPI003EE446F2
MEEILRAALAKTNIPFYNLRGNNKDETCIVYSLSEKPKSFCDDYEDLTAYKITVMLFCRSGLEKNKKIIKDALKSENIMINEIPEASISNMTEIISQSFICSYCFSNYKI